MRHTSTHTYALLAVSEAAYNEIKQKLEEAGYQDQFNDNDETPEFPIIDMHGIALVQELTVVMDIKESICYLCKKPIRGKVFYQGNSIAHPAHQKCLIVVEPSKQYGGGI